MNNINIFGIILACLCLFHCNLNGQSGFGISYPKTWILTEFYVFDPAKDNLFYDDEYAEDDKYSSEYARPMYKSFMGFNGWKGEYLTFENDSFVVLTTIGNRKKELSESSYTLKDSLLISFEDSMKVLMLTQNCLVVHSFSKTYYIYAPKKRKVKYCECDIRSIIRRKYGME